MSEAESLAGQGNSSKSDASQPAPTELPAKSTPLALSSRQVLAFDAMKKGNGLGKSAKLAGVDRSTLRRWIKRDPKFRAEYNKWEDQMFFNVRATLVAGGPAAARRLAKSARKDDKAAADLLKTVDKFQRQRPGPTDAGEIRQDQVLAEQERRVKLEDRKEKIIQKNLEHCHARSERSRAIAHREERDQWKALEAKALQDQREGRALPAPNPEAKAKADEGIARLEGLMKLITTDPKAIVEAALAGDAMPPQDATPPEARSIQPESPDAAAALPKASGNTVSDS